ncbi:MAG: hydroxymethylbilane synthase [Anaerophaga sp.]|uniref:hydroxymethylbilane synthase n=1 Tax=Anaerophaga thermohalophila TaxID=177400 RepID=UPI000237D38A|nr:hydroxymethylbilane synthase [Anaerophaga thermohalophila]MDI3521229.1 hydroxymethylbilane synthase [Anaerophaga sp.]MDN5291394.1 hydroxymethylbilane synthase [Anaerophaga sp.]
MTIEKINIGTRSSKLALWQAHQVKEALMGIFPQMTVNIIPLKTKGDAVLDVALSKIGDKGLFTLEIENALLKGEIDIAVHSLKDLPTILPGGLTLGGVLPRGEVRDVLVSRDRRKLKDMNPGDRIGTSSLRRQAQILHYNPELKVVDIRGNVNTRLRKMYEGHCDALVMAGAGFIRLGLESEITEYLDTDIMLPAVSQGAVAMEIRDDDAKVAQIVSEITDEVTLQTTSAERTFLQTIEGGCQVPVGCFSEIRGSTIRLTGIVASVDGCTLLKETMEGERENAGIIAAELARKILAMGGKEILNGLR